MFSQTDFTSPTEYNIQHKLQYHCNQSKYIFIPNCHGNKLIMGGIIYCIHYKLLINRIYGVNKFIRKVKQIICLALFFSFLILMCPHEVNPYIGMFVIDIFNMVTVNPINMESL